MHFSSHAGSGGQLAANFSWPAGAGERLASHFTGRVEPGGSSASSGETRKIRGETENILRASRRTAGEQLFELRPVAPQVQEERTRGRGVVPVSACIIFG